MLLIIAKLIDFYFKNSSFIDNFYNRNYYIIPIFIVKYLIINYLKKTISLKTVCTKGLTVLREIVFGAKLILI
jgi:hypothetical protein